MKYLDLCLVSFIANQSHDNCHWQALVLTVLSMSHLNNLCSEIEKSDAALTSGSHIAMDGIEKTLEHASGKGQSLNVPCVLLILIMCLCLCVFRYDPDSEVVKRVHQPHLVGQT